MKEKFVLLIDSNYVFNYLGWIWRSTDLFFFVFSETNLCQPLTWACLLVIMSDLRRYQEESSPHEVMAESFFTCLWGWTFKGVRSDETLFKYNELFSLPIEDLVVKNSYQPTVPVSFTSFPTTTCLTQFCGGSAHWQGGRDFRLWAAAEPVVMPQANSDFAISLLISNWAADIIVCRVLYSDRRMGWQTCTRQREI